jgi:hypothetical protein
MIRIVWITTFSNSILKNKTISMFKKSSNSDLDKIGGKRLDLRKRSSSRKKLKFGFFSFLVSFFILKIVLCCDQSVGQYWTFSTCFIVSSNESGKLQIDYKAKNLLKFGILNLASTTRLLRTERQREREKDRRKNDTWFEKIETQKHRNTEWQNGRNRKRETENFS